MTRAAFEQAVKDGLFLEWVEYGGNLYGTLRSDVEGRLAAGDDVILEIELQGARAMRRSLSDATFVFLAPPSAAELAERLRGRGTESENAVATRLRIAEKELAAAREFDHVVVNDVVKQAAADVAAIIRAIRGAQTEGD
jgi:guanylate kinase